MIFDLLPLLKGWRWKWKDVEKPFTIKAGAKEVVAEYIDKLGFVWSIGVTFNNPQAYVYIYYDERYATVIPKVLHEFGLTLPNPTGTWCTRYDDTEKVYSMAFTPTWPLAFNRLLRLSLHAPPDADITVINYGHLILHIEEPEQFTKSLHEVFGIPVIFERLRKMMEATPASLRIGVKAG